VGQLQGQITWHGGDGGGATVWPTLDGAVSAADNWISGSREWPEGTAYEIVPAVFAKMPAWVDVMGTVANPPGSMSPQQAGNIIRLAAGTTWSAARSVPRGPSEGFHATFRVGRSPGGFVRYGVVSRYPGAIRRTTSYATYMITDDTGQRVDSGHLDTDGVPGVAPQVFRSADNAIAAIRDHYVTNLARQPAPAEPAATQPAAPAGWRGSADAGGFYRDVQVHEGGTQRLRVTLSNDGVWQVSRVGADGHTRFAARARGASVTDVTPTVRWVESAPASRRDRLTWTMVSAAAATADRWAAQAAQAPQATVRPTSYRPAGSRVEDWDTFSDVSRWPAFPWSNPETMIRRFAPNRDNVVAIKRPIEGVDRYVAWVNRSGGDTGYLFNTPSTGIVSHMVGSSNGPPGQVAIYNTVIEAAAAILAWWNGGRQSSPNTPLPGGWPAVLARISGQAPAATAAEVPPNAVSSLIANTGRWVQALNGNLRFILADGTFEFAPGGGGLLARNEDGEQIVFWRRRVNGQAPRTWLAGPASPASPRTELVMSLPVAAVVAAGYFASGFEGGFEATHASPYVFDVRFDLPQAAAAVR